MFVISLSLSGLFDSFWASNERTHMELELNEIGSTILFFLRITSDVNQEARRKTIVDFSDDNFVAMRKHLTENYDCCREKCG